MLSHGRSSAWFGVIGKGPEGVQPPFGPADGDDGDGDVKMTTRCPHNFANNALTCTVTTWEAAPHNSW